MNGNLFCHRIVSKRIYDRYFSVSSFNNANYKCKVLVAGGGTGGCSTAAKLARKLKKDELIIIEPADYHYYQPLFTLIGAGIGTVEKSRKKMKDVLPKNATWLKQKIEKFEPKSNRVTTNEGDVIEYEYMVVALGLQTHYEKIPGLLEALDIPGGPVCSNYSPNYVGRTYEALKKFQSGNAIFTYPNTPVKCPGAPQKICYLTEHYLRKEGKRKDAKVMYNTSLGVIFGVKTYADALWKVCKKRDIEVNLRTNLTRVDPAKNEATFINLDTKKEIVFPFSVLHVTPPMSSAKPLLECKELTNEAGFVEVNPSTLQSIKFNNIFALGDCSSSPNSKTAAAAAAQCQVVYKNLSCIMANNKPTKVYDGYASCPLVTGYNSCILAEFDYNLKPLETFPFPQSTERYSMYLLKKLCMPTLYWTLMVNGFWNGPAMMRNLLHMRLQKLFG